MNDPQTAADTLAQTFERIHHEQMAGIPILNNRLCVQTLGFQQYQDRVIGIVITPWLMNLFMLPGAEDDWSGLKLGKKQPHQFPSGTYKFMINEFDGIGKCQTHSLFSPMNEFDSQEHAVAAAQAFLDKLMVETEPSEEDLVDEEKLGCIMRGEHTAEVNLDDFATIEVADITTPARGTSQKTVQFNKTLTRRDLLRGSFLKEG